MPSEQQVIKDEPPKKHPRNTPALTMDACALLDALEEMTQHLPLVSDESTRLHIEWVTPSFARWLDEENAQFPHLKSAAINSLNNCLKHSVHTAIGLLEMGVPAPVVLSFLPSELVSMLKYQNPLLVFGGID